jgi:hypothetical protein
VFFEVALLFKAGRAAFWGILLKRGKNEVSELNTGKEVLSL